MSDTEQMAPTPIDELAHQVAGLILSGHYEQSSKAYDMDLERSTNLVKGAIMESIATERAAREAAENELNNNGLVLQKLQTERDNCIERAETAEARLAELQTAAQCVINRKHRYQVWWSELSKLESVLSSTTPPPLLAEVERLREDLRTVTRDRNEWREHAQAETECQNCKSAESQLQIAREDSKRLDWLEKTKLEWHGHWGGGGGMGEPSSWQNPSAEWTVSRGVRDGTGRYPEELKRMTVREAIDASLTKITDGKEKQWAVEDPRMLREQIRVADAAYQHLFEEVKELRAFKAGALKLTTEASVNFVK